MLMVVILVPIELVSLVAGLLLQRVGLVWSPEDVDGYEAYLESRDPLLGWPNPSRFGTGAFAADGTRLDSGFPDLAQATPCVAVFGDSFTWGDEVGPTENYPAVLGQQLGCRVANFGTPGYGTDQAFLRYRDRVATQAPVVILGHYSEDIIRNVNRYRGFLSNNGYGLKPRFLLRDEELELLPIPDLSAEEFADLGAHPEWIPEDFFVPGGDAGIVRMGFPFIWTALSAMGHYRMQARMRGVPSYAAFYDADHPSGALEVTAAIMLDFVRVARSRGQTPVLVVIPDEKDLIELRAGRPLPYAPLVERIRAAGVEVPDVAEAALAVLGDREPCALYTRCGGAHFNPEGYAMLAGSLRPSIEAGLHRAP
jgi:hypothetical protein